MPNVSSSWKIIIAIICKGIQRLFQSVIISFLQKILSAIFKTENKIQPKAQNSLSNGIIHLSNSLCKKQSQVSIGRTKE